MALPFIPQVLKKWSRRRLELSNAEKPSRHFHKPSPMEEVAQGFSYTSLTQTASLFYS